MWPFTSKPVVLELSEKLRLMLEKERHVSPDAGAALRQVEERGSYAGRSVTYFRVFDPGNAKWGSAALQRYNDLDVRRILHSGHVERDGAIVLNRESSQT
jgi:hypothetical protein